MAHRHGGSWGIGSPRLGRPSLRVFLFALFTFAATLPSVFLGMFQADAWSESESTRADRETLLASSSLAREVAAFLDARAEAVKALALEFSATQDLSDQAVTSGTARFMQVFSGFYSVRVTDPAGTTLSSFPPQDRVPDRAYFERDYFQRVLHGAKFVISDMLRSKAYGRPAIIMAAPVRDPHDKLIGVVVAGVDLTPVENAIGRVTHAAPGLEGFVLDQSGQVVATSAEEAWQPLDQLGERPLFRAATSDAPERRRERDSDGELYRGTSTRFASHGTQWSAFTRWPEKLVTRRASNALREMTAFALGGLVLAVSMALLLARLVTAPLARMSAIVAGIARGELQQRPEPPRAWYPREFTSFAAAITGMLDSLESLLGEIRETALAISQVTQRLRGDSARLLSESEGHAHAVSHGTGAITKLTDSIADVSRSTGEVSRAAGATSASLTNLDTEILQIADYLQTLTGAIEQASSEVDQMGRQVNSSAGSTSELAENVQRTHESMQTLARSIELVQSNAAESERLAREAMVAAEAGRSAAEQTIGSSREIQESFSAVDAAVQGLAGRSEAIGQVVRVIEEVTRATELLSINASIIASQAGEHGRSFGIVAGRIKELALETAASTREITNLVDSVQADIEQAVQAVQRGQQTVVQGERRSEEAGRRLGVIIENSRQAENQVRGIARLAHMQATGLVEVRSALAQVSRATEEIERSTAAQRHAQEQMFSAIEQVQKVNVEVRVSTQAQTSASHAIAAAVRSMTARLSAIADASATQNDDRARIEHSLGSFEDALASSVARAREIDQVVTTLSARLIELERKLKVFG